MSPITKCVLLALAVAAAQAGGTSKFNKVIGSKATVVIDGITYTPPMIIIGKRDGIIIRCLQASPTSCEELYNGNSGVTATAVHGEFLFASLVSGAILRCRWDEVDSCSVFHRANDQVTGLAVASGFIHAGLRSGIILQCALDTSQSCKTFATLNRNITSLAAAGSFIYTGSASGGIDRCSKSNCSVLQSDGPITETMGLAAIGDTIYSVVRAGIIFGCPVGETNRCNVNMVLDTVGYRDMAAYNRKLYTLQDTGDVYVNDPVTFRQTKIAVHHNAESISFAYGTYAMQSQYETERSGPHYDIQERSPLEVFVKNGSLYDATGYLLDTRSADESYSQKAAIFVMGPDGQILLSIVHKLLHISSLLAGNPVSGAGLIVVDQGKIKSITSCSIHYLPDQHLNEQVQEALYLKGYTDPIEIHLCTYYCGVHLTCGPKGGVEENKLK